VAGADGHAGLLAGWLRRAQSVPAASAWVLRGSLVTAALCPAARAPADVDYLVPGEPSAAGDAAVLEAVVRAIASAPDPGPPLAVESTEAIWAETPWPGLRAHVAGAGGGRFQVDLAAGDPMCVPPRRLAVAGVDAVLACAAETLFAWKLHGLCEHGTGRWRAKDLCDLDLLWRHAALPRAPTRAAVELAFSSRGTPLGALDDFRARESWGRSRGGVRKWRALAKAYAGLDDFAATRARVRAALDELLG
jgi:hypothetical protein